METQKTQGNYWGIMRLSENKGVSGDSGRLLRLMRLMILIKTKGDS